jgi:bacteriophage exclusion system BrxC/D-like protein
MSSPAGAAAGVHSGAVLGGGVMGADDYAGFLGKEYIGSYLPAGGGSVKLVVAGDSEVANRFERSMRAETEGRRGLMVDVSAETTRAHLVDQVFFAVARQVDWDAIASTLLQAAYDDIAVPASPGRLRVAEVAEDHDLEVRELYRSVRRRLEQTVLTDTGLPRELRRALLRLAQSHLGSGDVTPQETRVVVDWLQGERVGLRELRALMIPARIGRHNARTMLTSVGRLLLGAGCPGLVLYLDLARLAIARRPPVPERVGLYYSTAAVLDAYELLRQLIDATDDLVATLVVAVVPPELMRDDKRGLPAYSALQLRVADEVRDRRRANPYASLARLEVQLEAVG